MKIIKSFLKEKGIQHSISRRYAIEEIRITLEKETRTNHNGEEINWERALTIHQNNRRKNVLKEHIGFGTVITHIETGKQKEVIQKLEEIL